MNDQEFEQLLERAQQPKHQAPDYLATKILANLPTQEPFEQLFSWFGASIWRGALTALLPLALGFSLGVGIGSNDAQEQDPWLDTESLMFADVLEEYDFDEI